MTNTFNRILILLITSLLFVVVVSIVFFTGEIKNAKAVNNVDHLTGQRIGTPSAYEGDYVLTPRDDITLLRYDTEADCLMALYYKKIDAIALVNDGGKYLLTKSSGLKINDTPIDYSGMCTLFVKDSIWTDRFNEWLKEYKKTEEYQEYLDKADNLKFYDGSEILEETGTGETIRIGYVEDYIPVSFTDTESRLPNGSEVDIFRRFANDCNYQIKWFPITEENGSSMIVAKQIDCILVGYSDVYANEVSKSLYSELSDIYRDSKIVLLEVEDYDKFSINSYLEEGGVE